jgi:Putative adhesin
MNLRHEWLLAPFALLIFSSCVKFSPSFQRSTETLPLQLRGAESLSVFNDVGTLRVTASNDAPSIVVRRTFVRKSDTVFNVRTTFDRLEIESRITAKTCIACRVDLELRVPPGLRLQLVTADGRIEVRGATAALEAWVDTGSIRADDLGSGRFKLGLNDGTLEVNDASGDIELTVDSGSMTLNRLSAALTATVMDGNVNARHLKLRPNSSNRISVDSGSIALGDLETQGAVVLVGSIDSGELNADLDGFRLERRRDDDSLQFQAVKAGDESTRLELRVSDGNIAVRSK